MKITVITVLHLLSLADRVRFLDKIELQRVEDAAVVIYRTSIAQFVHSKMSSV